MNRLLRLTAGGVLLFAFLFAGAARAQQKTEQQVVPLRVGWNLISLRVLPEDRAMPEILKDVLPSVGLVKDDDGNVFNPSLGIDKLSPWQVEKAYYVFAGQADTLRVEGTPMAAGAIALQKGWNLVPYPSDKKESVETALAGVLPQVGVMKDADGNVFAPGYGIDAVKDLEPGAGYRVYAQEAASLVFPGNVPPDTSITTPPDTTIIIAPNGIPRPDHYFTFDEEDDARWDYVGQWHGTPNYVEPDDVDGISGRGVRFSGIRSKDKYGYLAFERAEMAGDRSFTVAGWAKSGDAGGTIFYDGGPLSLNYEGSRQLVVRYNLGSGVNTLTDEGGGLNTEWKMFWLHYDASALTLSVAMNDRPWQTASLPSPLPAMDFYTVGTGYADKKYGVTVDEMMIWTDYLPSDSLRADMMVNHRGPAYFGISFTPPLSPFADVTLVDSAFVTDQSLVASGDSAGTYWLQPYPLYEWDPTMAAERGRYVWFRSTDHAGAIDGAFIGYSNSPAVPPSDWTLAYDADMLEAQDDNDWGSQVETPDVHYHPEDPDGKPFYMTLHTSNIDLTKYLTATVHSFMVYQETILVKSADLKTWEFVKVALPASPRTYFPTTVDTLFNHTGYLTALEWGDGTWRGYSNLQDGMAGPGLSSALLVDGTRGPVTLPRRPGYNGWWSSPDGITWKREIATAVRDYLPSYRGFVRHGGKLFGTFSNGKRDLETLRMVEINADGSAVWPGVPYIKQTPGDTRSFQGHRIYVEGSTAHIYVKKGYKEPNGTIFYYRATLRSPAEMASK